MNVFSMRWASDLLARAGLANAAGITFGGLRNLYTELGYPTKITMRMQRARFQREDIAARIVEAFPKATWRGGAEIIEDDTPEITTQFEETWNDLAKRLDVWNVFQRADILAGLGRYAVVLIGAPGDLEQPLETTSADAIIYLAPYAEDEAEVEVLVTDPADPRFGLPAMYHLRRNTTATTTQKNISIDKKVHWTRVIHVVDGRLDDPVFGEPRLTRVWNRLDDLQKVVGGGSEAFWQRVNRGLVFNIDPNVQVSETQITKLKEEAEELSHQMRRTIAARGMEVQDLGATVARFDQQVASLLSLISGATGIPQRLLIGSERGELASTQDKENWNDRVSDRRQEYAEPIVRTFVERLVSVGALPELDANDYEVRWPEIEELNEEQKASVALSLAGLNDKAKGAVILPEEIRDRVLKMEPLTEEQVAEWEEAKAARTPDMTPGQDPNDPDAQNAPPTPEDEETDVEVEEE